MNAFMFTMLQVHSIRTYLGKSSETKVKTKSILYLNKDPT